MVSGSIRSQASKQRPDLLELDLFGIRELSKLRRYTRTGDTCFITSVTLGRTPILIENIDLMNQAFGKVKKDYHSELLAWVILPEHFHAVIDLRGESLSNVVKTLKMSFSAKYRCRKGVRVGRVWQHRFWDHIIRDDTDLNRHIDYIHYNPVKHGLVGSSLEYGHSSFREHVKMGYYSEDWGAIELSSFDAEFGE